MNVSLLAVSVTSMLLMWSPPPTANCSCPPVTYFITVMNASLPLNPSVINTTYTTNVTNKTVYGLMQGMEYSFTVVGVDAGGRVGEIGVSLTMNFDSERLMNILQNLV